MREKATILTVFLFISLFSLFYPITCERCKVTVVEIEKVVRSGNLINVSGSVWYFELPKERESEEMVQIIESKAYSREDIEKIVGISYIQDADINVSFVSQAYNVILCSTKTDKDGKFFCENLDIGPFQGCGSITVNSGGKGDIPSGSSSSPICVFGKIPFAALIDPKCITILIVLGVLIAAAYAAGISPMKAFDITIPKIKGPKGYPGYKYKKPKLPSPGKAAIEIKKSLLPYKATKAGERVGINMSAVRAAKSIDEKMIVCLSIFSKEIHHVGRRIRVIDEELRELERRRAIAREKGNKDEIKAIKIKQKSLLKERRALEEISPIYRQLLEFTADGMRLNYSSCYAVYKEIIRIRQEMLSKRMKGEKVDIERMLDRIDYPNSLLRPIARALLACYDAKYAEMAKAIDAIKSKNPRAWDKLLESLEKRRTEDEQAYEILKVLRTIDPEKAESIGRRIYEINGDIGDLERHLGIGGPGIVGEINETKKRMIEEVLDNIGADIKELEKEIKEYVSGRKALDPKAKGALVIMEVVNEGDMEAVGIDDARKRYLIEDTMKRSLLRAYEDSITILSKREYFYAEGKEEKFSESGKREIARDLIAITSEMDERRFLACRLIELSGYIEGYSWIYDEEFDAAVSRARREVIKEIIGKKWIVNFTEEAPNLTNIRYLEFMGREGEAKKIWEDIFRRYEYDERVADMVISEYKSNPFLIMNVLLGIDESINDRMERYYLNKASRAFGKDFKDFGEAWEEIEKSFDALASEKDLEKFNAMRRKLEEKINALL